MGSTSVLSDDQVQDLWALWRASADPDARARLICHYLPLVDFIARGMGRTVPSSVRPDLHGFGVIGLMDAIDKFRPEFGNRFETYGSCRVRGAMRDGLRTLKWLPRGAERRPSRVIEKVVTVDFQTARNYIGVRLQDCLSDRVADSPFDDLLLEADYAEVVEALETLPERERKIVIDHYYDGRKLAEIGKDMAITESRVCQLHRRALRMLQEVLAERLSA
jgi:RNA polymerase sigma factor for flagellar operon FliA